VYWAGEIDLDETTCTRQALKAWLTVMVEAQSKNQQDVQQ